MRLIARFCVEEKDFFEIIDLFDETIDHHKLSKSDPTLPSLTHQYPSAIWFERKVHDDFGIIFENSFDTRPLVHHEHFPSVHPMRKNFDQKELDFAPFKPYPYEVIAGEGIFEVGVGPIHAGIIEPGHFHFSQEGENMLHQEVRHFYKYRAIEKILEGKEPLQALSLIARISGNQSVAYQSAYLQSLVTLHEDIRKYHALLLELERLAHHLTDLGFIPNDAGFAPALAFCSIKAEETRRMLKKVSGHRFGFDSVTLEAKDFDKKELENFLHYLQKELTWFKNWINDIPSLWDRFDNTGVLSKKKANQYGVVGVMARASGVAMDRREDSFYQAHGFSIQLQESGDVAARFKVRLQECFNAITMIQNFLDFRPTKQEAHIEDGEYFGFQESSLGELFLYTKIEDGRIDRFFARDPSFVNWQALHLMMPGNIIADFPLINKSCDLSYAGSDL